MGDAMDSLESPPQLQHHHQQEESLLADGPVSLPNSKSTSSPTFYVASYKSGRDNEDEDDEQVEETIEVMEETDDEDQEHSKHDGVESQEQKGTFCANSIVGVLKF